MIGEWIGHYQIVEIIGQGGMSTVYRATQPSFGREVAIKVLPRQLSEDPTFHKRFQREARVIARLEHRSILPVYDYGEQDGVSYIVMRLMEAGTLRRKLYYEGLTLPDAVQIIEEVAEALDYAHSQGVIHRDLKPSNILLDDNNNAYLTDFGIAKMLGSTSQVTGSGVVGTPNYMSPEQCQGKPTGPASDIYALGAILHEVLTGTPPYEADTPLAVMYMHVRDPIPSAVRKNPSMPPGIDAVIARAMAKKPEARYPTALALAADFRRVMEAVIEVTAGSPLPEPPSRPPTVPAGFATPPEQPPAEPPPPPPFKEFEDDSDEMVYVPHDSAYEAMPVENPRANVLLTVVGGVIAVAVLLGAAGVGLSAISRSYAGGGALFPTLPPTRTPGIEPTTAVAELPSATPSMSGVILEPTEIASRTSLPPTATFLPSATRPPATAAPPTAAAPTATRVPPTATPIPPTATPVPPTATSTATATPTATVTNTPAPTGGVGLLAYVEGSGTTAEIAVVTANGTERRQLTSNNYYDGEPDWSRNGARIAFDSSPGGNRDIYTMANNGTDVRQITSAPGDERHPDWAPNGLLIAYEAGDENSSEIYVINADGTNNTPLTSNSYGDRAPQFSPSGTQIAFMTDQRGKWEIAIMSYPSGEVVRIFDCPAPDCRFPTWSVDGTYIAYNTLTSGGSVAEIWEVNVTSGVSTVLVSGTDNGRPVYGGEGQFLYYNGTTGGNTDLYRINVNTLEIVRLTLTSTNDYAPDWGPG